MATKPNVSFLLGAQAKVDQLMSAKAVNSVVEGAFYLTEDSHRLYYGASNSSLVALNEGVTVVNNIGDLPDPGADPSINAELLTGQFYYVKSANILAVYNGHEWVQINPDTFINSLTIEVTETDASKADDAMTHKVTIAETMDYNRRNPGAGENSITKPKLTDVYHITTEKLTVHATSEDTIHFVGDSYRLIAESDNTDGDATDAYIALQMSHDNGAYDTTGDYVIDLKPGSNMESIQAGETNGVRKITFNALDTAPASLTNGAVSTDAAEAIISTTLVSNKTGVDTNITSRVEDTFNITVSDNVMLSTSTRADGTPVVHFEVEEDQLSSRDIDTKHVSIDLTSDIDTWAANNAINHGTVDIVGGGNIRLVDSNDNTITIDAKDTKTTDVKMEATPGTGTGFLLTFTEQVEKDSADVADAPTYTTTKFETQIDPIICYGRSEDSAEHNHTATAKFNAGTAHLDIYTTKEVDAIVESNFHKLDAMRYMGTISDTDNLPTTRVSNGDTYKLIADIKNKVVAGVNTETNPINFEAGDTFIAIASGYTSEDNGEDDDGYIVADRVSWSYIPSGDDLNLYRGTYITEVQQGAVTAPQPSENTVYYGTLITNETNDVRDVTVSRFDIGSATPEMITIIGSEIDLDQDSGTRVTIAHATKDLSQTDAHNDEREATITNKTSAHAEAGKSGHTSLQFRAINGVRYDDYGHLTGVQYDDVTVVDTHNHLQNIETTITNTPTANVGISGEDTFTNAKVTDIITMSDFGTTFPQDQKSHSTNYRSQHVNIAISAEMNAQNTEAVVDFKLVWGSF